MIQIPKNYKDGDVLIFKGNKLIAVDPTKIFNYDEKINELINEVKIKNQLLTDIINDHVKFKEKIEEYDKIKDFDKKINNLTGVVTKYVTEVSKR